MKPTEPEVMKIARLGGGVFVDVGANVGEYSLRLWRKYRTIVSFEPYHPAIETLRRAFGWRSLFCRLVPVECAISEIDGETFLFLDREGKRCSGSGDTIEQTFNYRPASIPGMDLITHHVRGYGGVSQLVDTRRLDTILPKL